MLYVPVSLLNPFATTPVSVFVAVTSTPGINAPETEGTREKDQMNVILAAIAKKTP